MASLGDCPYEGICTCRISGLKHRKPECKKLAVKFNNGYKRSQDKSQKGIP